MGYLEEYHLRILTRVPHRMADRIVVLSRGQVAENGSHDSLLSQGGTYARLFELQTEGYR